MATEITPVNATCSNSNGEAMSSADKQCMAQEGPENPPVDKPSRGPPSLIFITALIVAAVVALVHVGDGFELVSYGAPSCDVKLARFMKGIHLTELTDQLCRAGFTLLDDVLHLSDQQCAFVTCLHL
jgi:hypothetical protein